MLHSRYGITRRLGWLALLFALILEDSTPACAQRVEASRVYAFLVIDTQAADAKDLGIIKDEEKMKKLLQQIRDHKDPKNLVKGRLKIDVLKGEDVKPANILRHFQDLPEDPHAALFFYYSGHGGTTREGKHFLSLNNNQRLFRSELLRTMAKKERRLIVIVTDCCAAFSQVYGAGKLEGPPLKWKIFYSLFFKNRGLVDINACAEGETAVGNDEYGGAFSHAFRNLLCGGDFNGKDIIKELKPDDYTGFVPWQVFFQELEKQTKNTLKSFFGNHKQNPIAFALPPIRFGVRIVPLPPDNPAGLRGVVVKEVFPGTPAARAGLRKKDILLTLNRNVLDSRETFDRLIEAATGTVQIEIRRGSATLTVEVTLADDNLADIKRLSK